MEMFFDRSTSEPTLSQEERFISIFKNKIHREGAEKLLA